MNDERDALGRFENNLHVGTVSEQARAGVTVSDTEWSAAAKVGQQRVQEAVAHAARMGDPLYAEAMSRVLARERQRFWRTLLTMALLGLIGWAWWATPVGSGPREQYFISRHTTYTVSNQMPAAMLASSQADAARHVAYLFKPEAPLLRLFDGCAARPCIRPDLPAFDAFRRWAADTTTPWDEQLCGYFTTVPNGHRPSQPPSYLGITPTWRMDRARSTCVVTNQAAIDQRARWINRTRDGVAALLALTVLWRFRRWVVRYG